MAKRTGADELKLLGLLWKESPAGSRSGITTRSITALAVELADNEGLDAVTIGASATALHQSRGSRSKQGAQENDSEAGTTTPNPGVDRLIHMPNTAVVKRPALQGR